MSNNTALQDLCLQISKAIEVNQSGSKGELQEERFLIYTAVLDQATELLEKERTIIIEAYEKGWGSSVLDTGEKYYNDTFKK